MGSGKLFCFIGGILTLVSTLVLSFGVYPITGMTFFGIGFIMNLDNIFEDTFSYAVLFEGQDFVVYILVVILIIFLISGFIQLAGIKNRLAAIVGSILPIFISLLFISYVYDILFPDSLTNIMIFFWTESIVENVVPLHVAVGTVGPLEVSLGTFLLLGGGILGIIGGIMGRD